MNEEVSDLAALTTTDANESVEQLAAEVRALREGLGRLMSELDRRVRRACDPATLLRHPATVIGLAGLSLIVAGAVIAAAARNPRNPAGPIEKAQG